MPTIHKVIALAVAIAALLCTGCSSLQMNRSVSAPTAKAIADDIRAMYQAAGIPVPATAAQPTTIPPAEYAIAGYRLVDISCNNYFDTLVRASNRVKMLKADVISIGTAAGVIATLAESAPKDIGIIVAGFGLVEAIVSNFEQHAFASPYPVQTRSLVLKALNEYRASSDPSAVTTLPQAADQIAGYASLCSYSGIVVLSADAIANAVPEDTAKKSQTISPQERSLVESTIVSALGLPSGTLLSDSDLATLAAISDPTTPASSLAPLTKMLSPSIPATTITTALVDLVAVPPARRTVVTSAIWGTLTPLLTSNVNFKKSMDERKLAATGGLATPSAVPTKRPMISIRR